MLGLGMPEIIFILLLVLLFFGAEKLPGMGRAIGKALSEFKKGMTENPEEKKDKDDPGTK